MKFKKIIICALALAKDKSMMTGILTRKLLTLLYLSELYAVFLYVLTRYWKKRRELSVEVYNAHIVRYNRPLQIKMAVWSTFFKLNWCRL